MCVGRWQVIDTLNLVNWRAPGPTESPHYFGVGRLSVPDLICRRTLPNQESRYYNRNGRRGLCLQFFAYLEEMEVNGKSRPWTVPHVVSRTFTSGQGLADTATTLLGIGSRRTAGPSPRPRSRHAYSWFFLGRGGLSALSSVNHLSPIVSPCFPSISVVTPVYLWSLSLVTLVSLSTPWSCLGLQSFAPAVRSFLCREIQL